MMVATERVQMSSSKDSGGSYISRSVELVGKLTLKSNIVIDGHFEGSIISSDRILIGKQGYVKGDILANSLICFGKLEGTAQIAQNVEIHAPGHIAASVDCAVLSVEKGVFLEGSCLTRNINIESSAIVPAEVLEQELGTRMDPLEPGMAFEAIGGTAPQASTAAASDGAQERAQASTEASTMPFADAPPPLNPASATGSTAAETDSAVAVGPVAISPQDDTPPNATAEGDSSTSDEEQLPPAPSSNEEAAEQERAELRRRRLLRRLWR